jgi:hypothetical protein
MRTQMSFAVAIRSKRIRLAVVALLTGLSCLPFLQHIFWLADEGVLLQGAERLLRGERLYRDFFEFLPPGGFLLTAGWFGLTNVSFFSARVLATFTFIGIACVLYSVMLRVSCNTLASTVGVVVFVVTSQGLLMQVSHHWFTTLFCISALFGSLIWINTHRLSWVILAGLAGGAATMITPSRGALAVMAGLLAHTDGGRFNATALTHYVVAVAVFPMLLIVYVASQGSLSAAFDNVIVYPAVHYANIQSVPYGFGADAQNMPLKVIFPVAAVLAMVHVARDWRAALRDRTLHVCAAFALAAFAGLLVRPDTAHIAFAAPLVLPLILYSGRRSLTVFRSLQLATMAAVVFVMAPPTAVLLIKAYLVIRTPVIETPRGGVRILPALRADLIIRRVADLPVDSTIFYYPHEPLLAFLTARGHPSKLDIFVPNYTTPNQFEEECRAVMRSADWVVIDQLAIDNWQRFFPAMRDPMPPERTLFESAIERSFSLVANEGAFELRKASMRDESICSDVSGRSRKNPP